MADNPIDIKKLFNFDDTTPLDQVIVKIQQLGIFYDALIASAQKGAASVTQSMQVMQKSIDALEQEMVQADVTTKKGQETITNGAAITSKAVAQNEEYKKSINDLNATIKMLQDQIDKLSESNKKLPKDTEVQANSLVDLKAKLKDAADSWAKMGDATDAAIKQKALKNVTDLSQAVITQQKVINDAKKATDVAAGSYNDLALKVANATKQLKAMEGGVGSNSEQFKILQKTVIDGNKQLKEFDAVLGNNQRNVGAYKEGIEAALPAIAKFSPLVVEAADKTKAWGATIFTLFSSPVVAGLAVLAGLFAGVKHAVDLYTEGTVSGADKSSVFMQSWSTALEVINVRFKKLGQAIVESSEGTGILSTVIQGFFSQLPGGVALLAEYNARLMRNTEIQEMKNALQKEEIGIITEVSAIELEKEQETFAAREKEQRSLQERYEAIGRVNELRKEEVAVKLKSAKAEFDIQAAFFAKRGVIVTTQTEINELFKQELVLQKFSYDQIRDLANAQAKLIDLKKEEFQGTRRIQAMEIQLMKEQEDLLLFNIKQEKQVRDALNLEKIKDDQETNARILSNQSSTLNEKVEAETRNLNDAKLLNDKTLADELFAFREQALAKVVLDKETSDEIKAEAGDNLKLRLQLILEEKNRRLDSDATFNSQEEAITETHNLKIEELIKKSADNIVKITLETHKRMAEAEGSTSGQAKDAALIALDKSLKNREISLHNYNLQRAKIETEGKNNELETQNDQLQSDLDYFTSSKALEEKHADDILAIRKKLADNKLLIEDNNNKLVIARRQKEYELEKQLANEVVDTITAVGNNATNAKLQQMDDQLAALQANEQKQLDLAGDDAIAKGQIEKQFAETQARLQKEQAKLKHDQAIRDRDLAEAKIIINTEVAISEVLPNVIAAALIGAIGALALLKVATTPIPAYFTGVDYSKEGFAQVAERGRELAIDRSGDITLYDKPQIAYFKEGTKILNNAQTEPILEKMGTKHMDLVSHQLIDIGIRDLKAGQAVNVEILGRLDKLNETTRRNRPIESSFARSGSVLYEFKKEEETYVKRIKALSFGSWSKS